MQEQARGAEGEFHEPTDEAFACFRLELHRPILEGDDSSKRAWTELRECLRAVGRGVQRGIGDVVLHVRDLRAAGKMRFATAPEKLNAGQGIPLPVECYTLEDLKRFPELITSALRATGVSEYVYSSVARRLSNSEFSGERLKGLLRGEAAYPVIRNQGIMMRARNWRIYTSPRVANGKEYVDVEIEMSALKPGLGKMRLICKSLHGPKLSRAKNLIRALAELETATTHVNGWSKGALTIRPLRRPGQPEKWEILLPYSAPRAAGGGDVVLAIHRSVCNMLAAATNIGATYLYPGRDVVLLKHQMYARRAAVARDLAANPHAGRGKRRHYAALKRLQDAEARATQTHLWRAARWVQTIAEKVGAKLVLLDDFTSFNPDLPGPPFMPYVRRWPHADQKMKIIDALTRRAGIPVQEIDARYISQRCPECGYTGKENIKKMPVARGVDVEKGVFFCGKCGFETDLDAAAALNLLAAYEKSPPAMEVLSG